MEARRDVFQAIADPTRRAIIEQVAKGPLHLNAIASQFEMSRQAVSLHVRILTECGLLSISRQGRERYCEARLDKLAEVHAWTEQYQLFWTGKLHALKRYLEADAPATKPIKKKTSKRNKK